MFPVSATGEKYQKLLPYCQCFLIKLQRREVPNLCNNGEITFLRWLSIFFSNFPFFIFFNNFSQMTFYFLQQLSSLIFSFIFSDNFSPFLFYFFNLLFTFSNKLSLLFSPKPFFQITFFPRHKKWVLCCYFVERSQLLISQPI